MGAEIIEVAAGLCFRDGQLLITQRPAEAHLGGLWEFPGGKREPGESFEQCLKRELLEELGVGVRVGELVDSLTHAYPQKTVLLNFYRCELMTGEPQPIGCADFRWVRQDQLADYAFPAADERLLGLLKQNPNLWR